MAPGRLAEEFGEVSTLWDLQEAFRIPRMARSLLQ